MIKHPPHIGRPCYSTLDPLNQGTLGEMSIGAPSPIGSALWTQPRRLFTFAARSWADSGDAAARTPSYGDEVARVVSRGPSPVGPRDAALPPMMM